MTGKEAVKKQEAEKLLAKIDDRDLVICLVLEGKSISSGSSPMFGTGAGV